jgi:hypothetical protein
MQKEGEKIKLTIENENLRGISSDNGIRASKFVTS